MENPNRVSLGPMSFGSSIEMFDYFYKLLHSWSIDFNFNEYEHLVLMGLFEKGQEVKTGNGICGFQIRQHPLYKSRCFYMIREDGSVEEFSFRKCIHYLIPLPENMVPISDVNKVLKRKVEPKKGKYVTRPV
ncbi:protein EMBRYO DEFECTIVE 514-like [Impatiens glandulifera]|uniref:protein EMBRYO DEFECTIVE 514-like n=1 Tax=Impatiens glandulifera TaxID=253017 RepID=UPI001FB16007|nr:protein EMBRYO DEFECTIVE 514-like [Impatiens glandulifera]